MRQSKRSKLELRGLLIGVVLGDGSLSKATSSSNSHLNIGHSIKQKDYCIHKLELLANLLRTKYSYGTYNVYNKNTDKYYPVVQGKINVHRYFTKLRKYLYVDNKKIVSDKILNYITPEGLAYWYMDDGGVITDHKQKRTCGIFISTQCFTYEEHLKIQKMFKNKWNIETKIWKHGRGQFRLTLNKTQALKFFELTAQFQHPSLAYKFELYYDKYLELFNKRGE